MIIITNSFSLLPHSLLCRSFPITHFIFSSTSPSSPSPSSSSTLSSFQLLLVFLLQFFIIISTLSPNHFPCCRTPCCADLSDHSINITIIINHHHHHPFNFFSFRLHRHYCQDYHHHNFIFVAALLAVQIFPIMHFIKLHFPFPGSFFIPSNEIKEFCDLR